MCLKIMQGLSFLSQVLIYSYFRVNDLFLSKPPSTKSLTQKSSSYISELMIKIQTSLFCLMGNEPLVVRDGIYWTHPLLPLMFQTQLPQLRRHRGPGPAHGSLPFDKLIHCQEQGAGASLPSHSWGISISYGSNLSQLSPS